MHRRKAPLVVRRLPQANPRRHLSLLWCNGGGRHFASAGGNDRHTFWRNPWRKNVRTPPAIAVLHIPFDFSTGSRIDSRANSFSSIANIPATTIAVQRAECRFGRPAWRIQQRVGPRPSQKPGPQGRLGESHKRSTLHRSVVCRQAGQLVFPRTYTAL